MISHSRKRAGLAPPGIFLMVIIAFGILLSAFSFWSYFNTKPLSSSDLTEINGSLRKTAMQRGKGASYFLWLEGYPCTFNISSIYIRESQWQNFVGDTTSRTPIRLFIRKSDTAKLGTDTSIDIYQLFSDSKAVLSLEKHNEAAMVNARLALILGFVFSALTVFLIILFVKMI